MTTAEFEARQAYRRALASRRAQAPKRFEYTFVCSHGVAVYVTPSLRIALAAFAADHAGACVIDILINGAQLS